MYKSQPQIHFFSFVFIPTYSYGVWVPQICTRSERCIQFNNQRPNAGVFTHIQFNCGKGNSPGRQQSRCCLSSLLWKPESTEEVKGLWCVPCCVHTRRRFVAVSHLGKGLSETSDHPMQCVSCLLCPQQPPVCRFLPREGDCWAPAAQTHTPGVMLLLIKSRMEKIKAMHFFLLFFNTPPPFFFIPHTTRQFLILKLRCFLLQRSLEASPDCLVEIWLVLDCHFNLATSESCFPVACQLNWCVTDECTAHRWCLSV